MRTNTILLFLLTFISGCGTYPVADQGRDESIVIHTNLENLDSLLSAEPLSWKNEATVKEGAAYSGKYAIHLDRENEYGFLFEQKLGYISDRMPTQLTFEAQVYSEQAAPEGNMVVSIDDIAYYQSFPIEAFFAKGSEWKKVRATFIFPDTLKPYNLIKVYFWNNKSSDLLIDDLSLTFDFKPASTQR